MKFDQVIYDLLSEKDEMSIGIYPGSFTPPHIGHYNIAKQMISDGNTYNIILASQKERQGMSGEITEKIWSNFYIPILNNKNLSLVYSPISPVKDMADLILLVNGNTGLKNVNPEIEKLAKKLKNGFITFNIYTGESKYDSFKTNPKYATHKTGINIIPTDRPIINLGQIPIMITNKDGSTDSLSGPQPMSGTLSRNLINKLSFDNPQDRQIINQIFPEEVLNQPGFKELFNGLKS